MTYQLDFPPDSPVGRIYSALKKSGVSDKELDQGFDAVVSSKADKFKKIKAADKIIQREEVLLFALHNFVKFQKLLHDNGFPVIWSLDDLDDSTGFDQEIRSKITRAITEFKAIIGKSGLSEKDPRFQEKLALSLFFFTLASLNGRTALGTRKQLKEAKLEEVEAYINKHGGLALGDNKIGCGIASPALTALKEKCSSCIEDAAVLFAVFKMAGLNATFINSLPTDATAIKYGFPPGTRHVAVVLSLPGRERIMDPGIKNSNALEEYKSGFVWWKTLSPLHFLADFYNNVSVAYSDRKDRLSAYSNLRTSVSIFPYNVNRLINLVGYDEQKKDVNTYIKYLERVLELKNDDASIRNNLANAYSRTKQYEKAIVQFELLYQTGPKKTNYLSMLVDLYKKIGDLKKALERAEMRVKLEPKNVEALNDLALIHLKMQDFDKMELVFLEVLKIDSKQHLALHNLGVHASSRGVDLVNNKKLKEGIELLKKGRDYFERALQSDPNSKATIEMLEQTKRILKELEPTK